MKLNIGSGGKELHKKGFINIDIAGEQYADGDTQFIRHDLRQGLPLKDLRGQPIKDLTLSYSSHNIEHLSNENVKVLLKELYNKTVPGGITSHCIPDFPSTFKAYIDKDMDYFKEVDKRWYGFPQEPHSWISFLEFSVYQGGEHISLWDEDKAIAYLEEAGWQAKLRSWDELIDSHCPIRTKYSFYVEGIKTV